jgi:hypothetical protein
MLLSEVLLNLFALHLYLNLCIAIFKSKIKITEKNITAAGIKHETASQIGRGSYQ